MFLRNSQKRKPRTRGMSVAGVTRPGWGAGTGRAIVRPLVRVSEDTHTRARGPRRAPPRPPAGTHTLPHPRPREKVFEVFFFSSEEKAPSIERMYSGTWENSCALSPPNYPQVAVLRGAPHPFLPGLCLRRPRPQLRVSSLSPCQNSYSPHREEPAKVVGGPPQPPTPGPRGGRLKTPPSGAFFF